METENKKFNVIVVEDDEDTQRLLQIYLGHHFDVSVCNSAETFYSALKEKDTNVILMDIALRGSKDGLQLTKEIKQNDAYKHIPIVAYTAYAYRYDRTEAYNAGVSYFLTKPVKNKLLYETLITAIQKGEK